MHNPVEAEGQAVAYAKQLDVPFVFLTNGEEIWFWEYEREAHPHQEKTFTGRLWELEDIAALIDAAASKPGRRGPYIKKEG